MIVYQIHILLVLDVNLNKVIQTDVYLFNEVVMIMISYEKVLTDYFCLIDSIDDTNIKTFVYRCLNILPEDFWIVPTSSSGTHHPPESNISPLGLMCHCVKACAIAKVLMPFYGLTNRVDKIIFI
jgi:hypothetical protein